MQKNKISLFSYIWVALYACCATLCMNLFMNETGFIKSSDTFLEVANAQFSVPLLQGLLTYGVFAPIVEEFLFRYLLFGKSYRYVKKLWPCVILSSLLFGLYHGNPVQGVYGGILGVVLCLLYFYYGTVLICIWMHGIGNMMIFMCVVDENWQNLFVTHIPWWCYGVLWGLGSVGYIYAYQKRE